MKLKNLLLFGLLLVSSFGQEQLWGAGEFKGPAAVGRGPDAGVPVVDHKAADVATGGAEAGIADAAVVSSIPAEGPLAKLELLRGQLTGAPEGCRRATLVHGAMLWEFGIIRSLYTLLITPKKDSAERLVAGVPICHLGVILKQLFHLAGRTLTPTQVGSSLANRLTPKDLGQLYAAYMDKKIDEWFPVGKGKISSTGKKNSQRLIDDHEALRTALKGCYQTEISDVLNPVNLCPSIIMAYFWAKYIMPASDLTTARANLTAFNVAAFPAASLASAVSAVASAQSPDVVETDAIERIKTFYKYDIPKPPVPKTAKSSRGDRRFTDCGESGLRGLFQAIFFNKNIQRFVVPEDQPEGFYDNALITFFKENSTQADQDTEEARNAWGAVISGRSDIAYEDDGCGIYAHFKNVMCMLAQLVPGVYKNLCTSCGCSPVVTVTEAASGAGGAIDVVADGSLPAQIAAHFESSPCCAKKMLEVLVEYHNLFLSEYNSADNKNGASWKLSRTKLEEAQCSLLFETSHGHMNCELEATLDSTYEQLTDPILGCHDALTSLPLDPDMIAPLVFAAARIAQKQDFLAGYLALLPGLEPINPERLQNIRSAIEKWGWLRPEDARTFEEMGYFKGVDQQIKYLAQAAQRGLANTCKFYVERYRLDKAELLTEALFVAIENGYLAIVKYLCEHGADVNIVNRYEQSPLFSAIENGHLDIVECLCEHGADVNIVNRYEQRPLLLAAKKGNLAIVKYLCEEQSVDPLVSNENAASALSSAVCLGHLPIVKYLCGKQLSKVPMNIKTSYGDVCLLAEAVLHRHIEIVKYLCEEQAADVNIPDKTGKTAIELAVKNNTFRIIQYLCGRGVTALDKALLIAVEERNLLAVLYLWKRYRAVLIQSMNEYPGFFSEELQKIWYQPGIDLLAKAFLAAVNSGSLPVIKYLREEGARVDATVLGAAEERGLGDVADYLRPFMPAEAAQLASP